MCLLERSYWNSLSLLNKVLNSTCPVMNSNKSTEQMSRAEAISTPQNDLTLYCRTIFQGLQLVWKHIEITEDISENQSF